MELINSFIHPGDKIWYKLPGLDDYFNIKNIWEDSDTMEAVGGIYPISEYKFHEWLNNMIKKNNRENCYYLIMTDNLCIGEVSFHRFNKAQKNALLNIKVKSNFRNRGIGKMTLDFILDIFFNKWNGLEILDSIREENTIGFEALISYGFQKRINEKNEIILFLTKELFLTKKLNP